MVPSLIAACPIHDMYSCSGLLPSTRMGNLGCCYADIIQRQARQADARQAEAGSCSAPGATEWGKLVLFNGAWSVRGCSVVFTGGLLAHVTGHRHRATWIGLGEVHGVMYANGCYPMHEPGHTRTVLGAEGSSGPVPEWRLVRR